MPAITLDGQVSKVKIVIDEPFSPYGFKGYHSQSYATTERQAVTMTGVDGTKYWFKLPASAGKLLGVGDEVRVRASVSAVKDTITFLNRVKLIAAIDAEV